MSTWTHNLPDGNDHSHLHFQHPPSSWNVLVHAHTSHELLEFWTWKRFGETVSNIVVGGDVCVVDVTGLDSFAYVVVLNVNMF